MRIEDPRNHADLRTESLDDGTVRVAVAVSKPVEETWNALTDEDRLARWFGNFDRPLRPASRTRVDFGDGDFFDVEVVDMTAPRRIEFDWRFLGVGPSNRIIWTAEPSGGGCEVQVEDRDPNRQPAECGEMLSGWSDFLLRLKHYVDTGEPSRYEWRGDIDGGIELMSVARHPLAPDEILRWLPVATDGHQPRWYFVVDSDGPRRFPVRDWSLEPESRVTFDVELEDGALTHCSIVAEPRPRYLRLRFRHSGWQAVDLPDRTARQLRNRFADAWRAALEAAADLAGSPAA